MDPIEEHASMMSLSHENHLLKKRIAELESKMDAMGVKRCDNEYKCILMKTRADTSRKFQDAYEREFERAETAEAKVKELEAALKACSVELAYLVEQTKARPGGSVDRAYKESARVLSQHGADASDRPQDADQGHKVG